MQCTTKIADFFLLEDLVPSVHHTVATDKRTLYLADGILTHVRKDCTKRWWG